MPFFLQPEDKRSPEHARGAEITNEVFIRISCLYPDLERGWKFWFYSSLVYFFWIATPIYTFLFLFSMYLAIQWMDVELIGCLLLFGSIFFLNVLVEMVKFHQNRRKIDELLITAGRGTYVYDRPLTPEAKAIEQNMEAEAKNSRMMTFLAPSLIAAYQGFITPLYYVMRGQYTSIVPNQTVPINKHSPVPVWMPFEVNTANRYFLLFFIQSLPGCIAFFIICATTSFFVGCICILIKELKLFLKSIEDIYDRAVYMYVRKKNMDRGRAKNFEDPFFQKCMRDCLRENVAHQNAILQFFKTFQQVFGWPIFAIVTGAAIEMSTPPYTLLKVMQHGEVERILTLGILMFGYALLCLSLVATCCSYGQAVMDHSDKIQRAYYDMPWQQCDVKFRKMLIIAMTNSHQLIIPKAQVIGVAVTLATLMDLVKQSYTIFNFLLTTG